MTETNGHPSPEDFDALLAFHAALASVEQVTKSKVADTGKFSYGYADLGTVLGACQDACRLHGLELYQSPSSTDGMLTLYLTLIHKGGGTIDFPPLQMVLPKEAQPYGSALTYARRYQLMTIFGIAPEDDDGHAATVAAQTAPGRRTEAERMILEELAQLSSTDLQKAFKTDFKEHFKVGLSDLPASRHGEALAWTKEWLNQPAETPAEVTT